MEKFSLLFERKKIIVLLTIFLSFCNFAVYTSSFSSSIGGTTISFTPASTDESTSLVLNTFFGIQLQLNKYFSLDGKFSTETENIANSDFLEEIPATFTIDSASIAYRFETRSFSGQATTFIGSFELPGTDTFGKKYLGIQNIISPLLCPQTSLFTAKGYSIDGIGFSIGGKFETPTAAGFYIYYNNKEDYVEDDGSAVYNDFLNFDTRIAHVSDNFFMDFVWGASFPLKTEIIDDDLYISTDVEFHAMTTMVIGGNPYTNIFIQGGISRIETNLDDSDSYISLSDIYVFLEPRFATKKLRFSFSLFCLPEDEVSNLENIDNSTGTAFSLSSMPIIIFDTPGEIGSIFSASVPNPAIETYSIDNLDFQIAPYMHLFVGLGECNTSLHIYPLRYTDIGSMFMYTIGYKLKI